MKYIKAYESMKTEPKIGDYILANSTYASTKLQNFLLSNIGKIIEIETHKRAGTLYNVLYEDVPDNIILDDDTWKFELSEILSVSIDKEELKIKLDSNKYNL